VSALATALSGLLVGLCSIMRHTLGIVATVSLAAALTLLHTATAKSKGLQ
jgi:hypothetical protein